MPMTERTVKSLVLPNRKVHKEGLKTLTHFQRQVILGMILGDSHLRLQQGAKHAYLALRQGEKQKELVDHLFAILRPWTWYQAPKAQYHGNKDYPTQTYCNFYFQTFSHRVFTDLHGVFYQPSGSVANPWIKVIPEKMEEWISPIAFAYHVMTDGSFAYKSLYLHTNSYTRVETLRYVAVLNRAFGLHGYVTPKGPYWIIRFPTKDLGTLQTLLEPHMLPSFRYKLGFIRSRSRCAVHGAVHGALDWS